MYRSVFSVYKRLAFGSLSAISCIALLTGLVLYLTNGADGLGTVAVSATVLLTLLGTLIALIGVISYIIQRVRRSVMTKKRLVCSGGFLTFGALAAAVCASASVILDVVFGYETGMCFFAQCVMCAGGWLCFLFGMPLLRSYKPYTKILSR